jgi:hypothetical protein
VQWLCNEPLLDEPPLPVPFSSSQLSERDIIAMRKPARKLSMLYVVSARPTTATPLLHLPGSSGDQATACGCVDYDLEAIRKLHRKVRVHRSDQSAQPGNTLRFAFADQQSMAQATLPSGAPSHANPF